MTVIANPNDVPAGDVGDTIATARNLALAADRSVIVQATLGDGAQGSKDVDFYRVDLAAGDILRLSTNSANVPYDYLRIFNAAGVDQTASRSSRTRRISGPAPLPCNGRRRRREPTTSASASTPIRPTTPNTAGSGNAGSYAGAYQLNVARQSAASTVLTGITATAARGAAAQAGVPAANVGQTITLTGTGLNAGDQVVFSALDINGTRPNTA